MLQLYIYGHQRLMIAYGAIVPFHHMALYTGRDAYCRLFRQFSEQVASCDYKASRLT
jgi:hypothetical protein